MAIKIRTTKRTTRKLQGPLRKADYGTLPPILDVPEPPTYTDDPGDRALHDEQQVARVEILMMKGIRGKRQLMALLDIKDPRALDRYVKRVLARWELTGSSQDHARHRGEGLSRLDLIESELWSKLQNKDGDGRASIVVLNTLLSVQKQRSELLGLTPKAIERIGQLDRDGITFTRQAAVHERLTMLAGRMVKMIEERTGPKVIENEPGEQDS
jgi:hypothetical protein